jgi:glucose-1-phosphate thymidylyltransferase
VTGPDDLELFRELLGHRYRDLRLHYAVQVEPAGVADAVCQAAKWVRGPFVVLLGDCYFDGDLRDFRLRWEGTGSDGAVLVEPVAEPGGQPMGLVTLADDRIVRIFKAPWAGDTEWRVCGAFLFPESFFDVAAETPRAVSGEYELEDVVRRFIEAGATFTALPFSGWRRNINTPGDLAAVEQRIAAGG